MLRRPAPPAPLRNRRLRAAGWLLAGALALAASRAALALPSLAELRAAHQPSDLTLLDRHGEPLQTLRVDPRVRRLPWVALDDFSPALRVAVVLGEDRRFLTHGGVDWSGLARSAWANLRALGSGAPVQGASTLSMQLAGLIDADLARPAGGRSLLGKLSQIAAARQLEARWRKREILEAYLNLVPLRGELLGLPAASRLLLGKHPSGLDAQEAALLAALLRAPNASRSAVTRRACELLQLQQLGCDGLEGLAGQALARGAAARADPVEPLRWAPHYARAAWAAQAAEPQAPGAPPGPPLSAAGRWVTPLDAGLQRTAVQLLRRHLAELALQQVEDAALLVLDNASGEVRAWVGSSGPGLSAAAEVDAVLARRQPGSALKPFVYALAFERRLITPASLLDDRPGGRIAGDGLYAPRNYDLRHHGWVSARTALASSLNVPAVQLAHWLGPDPLFARLQAHGLALPGHGGHHGPALALGTAEVTLLDLTNAYRSLANGGRWSPVRLLPPPAGAAPLPTRQASQPAAAYLVGDILADNAARALTFGLDSPLVTRGWAAVKTGTSKDLRDNWCIGWTDRYTVGVWVGNASGAPMQQVSGSSGAAPIWRELVQWLHADQPSRAPAPPPGVHRRLIALTGDGHGPTLPTAEVFLAGTELASLQRGGHTRGEATDLRGIASPRDGSLFAIDPDIPPAVQRIVFEGEPGQWWLNGRRLGQGARLAWAPWPGRHRLELRLGGQRVERVHFEVRGATLRAPARSGGRANPSR
ncbi:MAG: penicillin-binding protein 1C [Burkholderiaceae bacterium]|nr:penicillin-binding protein 1C [Burkholderiaceae bacterium]